MVAMAEFVSRDVFEAVGRLCAYYGYLEGAVAQAIWLELKLDHDYGHPVTDRLQLRDSYKLLADIHRRAGRDAVSSHLKTLRPKIERLMEDRNLVVHGTIVFDGNYADDGSAIRWLMRRGTYNRKPQPVTLVLVEGLIADCKFLTTDLSSIGRFYHT